MLFARFRRFNFKFTQEPINNLSWFFQPDVIKSSPSKEEKVQKQWTGADVWTHQDNRNDYSIWLTQPKKMSQVSSSLHSSFKEHQPSFAATSGVDDEKRLLRPMGASLFSSFPLPALSESPKNRSRYKTELCRPFQVGLKLRLIFKIIYAFMITSES